MLHTHRLQNDGESFAIAGRLTIQQKILLLFLTLFLGLPRGGTGFSYQLNRQGAICGQPI